MSLEIKWPASTMIVYVLVLLLAVVGLGWILRDPTPEPGSSVQLTEQTKAEKNAKGEKVPYTPKKPIRTLPPKVKVDLGLPEDVQKDDTKKVLGTAVLNAEKRKYDLSAVIDDFGDTAIYAKPQELPWLQKSTQTEVAFGPVITNKGQVWELEGRQDLIQSKKSYGFVHGRLDSEGDWAAGAKLGFRW